MNPAVHYMHASLDRRVDAARAQKSAEIVAQYEPLVRSVAQATVVDRVLARAIAQEALLAVLVMPASSRTSANVIATTRRIATENAARFAAYAE